MPPEPHLTLVLEMLQIAVERSYRSAEATGHEVLSNGFDTLLRGKPVRTSNAAVPPVEAHNPVVKLAAGPMDKPQVRARVQRLRSTRSRKRRVNRTSGHDKHWQSYLRRDGPSFCLCSNRETSRLRTASGIGSGEPPVFSGT
jgi:hypothetical protein